MRRLALALACALLSAMTGAAAITVLYGLWPTLVLDMDHDRAGVLSGFYRGEYASGVSFAWTSERGDVTLPGLDRSIGWTVTVRVRGARQDTSSLPTVTLLADGAPLVARQTSNEFQDVTADVPVHERRARGLVLSVASSNTFLPGPKDPRRLGVQVDSLTLAPDVRGAAAPRRAVFVVGLASACFGAIFGLLGATPAAAVGASVVVSVAVAAVIRAGLGPYDAWLGHVIPLAGGVGVALLAAVVFVERWRGERLRQTARFAFMFTASVVFLKLLILFHPDKPLVDAVFQAHRFEAVVAGHYLFTSMAPGGHAFPYPIALYLTALPLSRVVTDHVLLLRLVAVGAEAASCLFCYWMIVRGTGDRLIAAMATALLQVMPLGFSVLAYSNLTQVFGQAIGLIALALVVDAVVTDAWWPRLAGAGAVTVWAFLGHTGTFATLTGILGAGAMLLVAAGEPPARRAGLRLLAMVAVAVVLAVALYYGRFMPTYRAEYAQITGELTGAAPAAATSPGPSGFPSRVFQLLTSAVNGYTWPFLLLAVAGVPIWFVRNRRSPFTLILAGWLVACLAFVVLGLLTPVNFRNYYAALPAVAILAGGGAVSLWRAGGYRRGIAALLLLSGTLVGVNYWLTTLGAGFL